MPERLHGINTESLMRLEGRNALRGVGFYTLEDEMRTPERFWCVANELAVYEWDNGKPNLPKRFSRRSWLLYLEWLKEAHVCREHKRVWEASNGKARPTLDAQWDRHAKLETVLFRALRALWTPLTGRLTHA